MDKQETPIDWYAERARLREGLADELKKKHAAERFALTSADKATATVNEMTRQATEFGFSYLEIGELLGETESQVSTRIATARRSLGIAPKSRPSTTTEEPSAKKQPAKRKAAAKKGKK